MCHFLLETQLVNDFPSGPFINNKPVGHAFFEGSHWPHIQENTPSPQERKKKVLGFTKEIEI